MISDKDTQLRTVLEAVPNGIIVVDEHGAISRCNAEAEKMFGYEPGELLGLNIERLVPPSFRHGHPRMRTGFLQHPTKRQMGAGRDLSGLRKDGREIPVEIGLNPLRTDDGFFVLASVVDITERKHAEQQLRNAYKELQRRNQEMEQFIYTASHDLRSPLV